MDLRRTAAIAAWVCAGWHVAAVAAELEGQVELAGPVPAPTYVDVDRDPAACGTAPKRSARLLVSEQGGVQNAVVHLPHAPAHASDGRPAVVDQRGCEFVPHVLCVRPGDTVRFLNSDPAVHEGRCFHEAQMLTRFSMAPRGRAVERQFAEEGPLLVRCGLHPWMHAWIYVVAEGRYTVTDAEGRFVLQDVPPGIYDLEVWHESLGRHRQRVTIGHETSVVQIRLEHPTGEEGL